VLVSGTSHSLIRAGFSVWCFGGRDLVAVESRNQADRAVKGDVLHKGGPWLSLCKGRKFAKSISKVVRSPAKFWGCSGCGTALDYTAEQGGLWAAGALGL